VQIAVPESLRILHIARVALQEEEKSPYGKARNIDTDYLKPTKGTVRI